VSALADDLKANGLKHPLAVHIFAGSAYLMNGHHRLLAAEAAGLTHVQVRVRRGPYRTDLDDANKHLGTSSSNPAYQAGAE
jgi:ParB-like chromosome segregation protein Spo0J